jgi:hypothetical protein
LGGIIGGISAHYVAESYFNNLINGKSLEKFKNDKEI